MNANVASVRRFDAGCFVGEPAIVAKPGARDESDAYIMTFSYDRAAGTSAFVIIDGADFTGPPVATVQLPVRVPNGYGSWVAAALRTLTNRVSPAAF
jgi:carotenoid cleavage dioxygenase-like enzyme